MYPATSSLDTLDLALLKTLQADGRRSYTEIAQDLNVSVGTVRNRIKRLIEDKTLFVYGRVEPNRVGFKAYAHLNIAVRPADKIEAVAAQIAAFPEVSFLAMVSGEYDLELNVMCRDNQHLTELMNERLHKIEGVFQTRTTMYLKLYKVAQPDLDLIHPLREAVLS